MSQVDAINHLADIVNMRSHYIDAWGNHQEVTFENKKRLLGAMGFEVDNLEALQRTVYEKENSKWNELLAPVKVCRIDEPLSIEFSIKEVASAEHFTWELQIEDGDFHSGVLIPEELEVLESKELEGIRYNRYRFIPPVVPDLGYHKFNLRSRQSDSPVTGTMSLIVVPTRCFQPEPICDGGKVWGASVQLYTLRSERNWGVGDFTDLKVLAKSSGAEGCHVLGLNPMHAMFPHNAHAYSPYSPSSRLYINIIYIDPVATPEYEKSEAAKALMADKEFQAELERLRGVDNVDYPGVVAAKRRMFELIFEQFTQDLENNTERAQAFHTYCEKEGEQLFRHALYEALQEHFYAQDWSYWGWPVWPEEYRDPEGEAPAQFAKEHAKRVQFFQYLQWLAYQQLEEANNTAKDSGMAVGLYRDLAVGIDRAGTEAWSCQDLYTKDANVGAPPDALCTQGQDWGLPALNPDVLINSGYESFIQLMRANMQGTGALRIDHVLGMMRLWWVPLPGSSADGCYVYYPLDDLFGIIALESQRNQCMVIGEDLGTVPDEIRIGMSRIGLFCYRVFFFERNEDNTFLAPEDYPEEALATVSTHDLPTLQGYWQSRDIEVRDKLGMIPTPEMRQQQFDGRSEDRHLLLTTLQEQGIEYGELPDSGFGHPEMTEDLRSAIQVWVARTASRMMLVQLEDILGMTDQVNLPGTDREYPNWQRKLSANVEQIFATDGAKKMARALTEARNR
ncbi:MAG: 4-alpha-glucanotransferase [Kangiellaceae bacterium]|nr:4-alpha-glucanotransferase [Kangiellaceae bacterium]|tara:strand:- start:8738 stop:10939 length:2202 start_codon:yes stop_codon:yes gene_type:complete